MAWADRTPEERLSSEVLRLRETLAGVVSELKDMHVGTATRIATDALNDNFVSDIINNEEAGRHGR